MENPEENELGAPGGETVDDSEKEEPFMGDERWEPLNDALAMESSVVADPALTHTPRTKPTKKATFDSPVVDPNPAPKAETMARTPFPPKTPPRTSAAASNKTFHREVGHTVGADDGPLHKTSENKALRSLTMDDISVDEDQLQNSMEGGSHHSEKKSQPVTNKPTLAAGSSDATAGSADSATASSPTKTASTTPAAAVGNATPKKKNKEKPRIPAAEVCTDEQSGDRIRLGICAMDKKAKSKPMAEILSRLDENLFHVIFFGDEVILNQPVEEWPICHYLIAFFSKGYPLDKAKDYVNLRKPFILNDLQMQENLQDRRKVYDLLEESGIDVPRHVYLSRDNYISTGTGDGNGAREQDVQEFDDHIEVNGITINKPFVEKPVNAEDHNIAIYYPTSAGGGCKKLFRKVGNRSSEFYPDINEVRRDGSYIYEEFVETQGTDVKMYTVGPDYGHAEARKSPTVDGKVERNSDGKEVRFPVILTYREKEIARRIVIVFKQFVCGFDILRVQEGHTVISTVCDVNGFSFVKNSRKYYDDCAQILSEHILAKMKPAALKTFSTLDPLVTTSMNNLDDEIIESDTGSVRSGAARRNNNLLSRAARMLQGEPGAMSDEGEEGEIDTLSHSSMVDNAQQSPPRGSVTGETSELLSTAAATLMEGALPVREFPDNLTSEPASLVPSTSASINGKSSEEDELETPKRSRSGSINPELHHQEELRCVLAIIRHGDRTPKQKLKVNMTEPHILEYFHNHSDDCTKDLKVKAKTPMTEFLETVKTTLQELPSSTSEEQLEHRNIRMQLLHMRDILERWKIHGLNRKLQIKPRSWEDYEDPVTGEKKCRCTEVQLILKWGGNLTKLGEKQAINLGHRHRHDMYPDAPGGGILRLHSTFRHDLKIKTSDEGRVMKTAAAFAKGLLELEGDLPPILVSLVHKEKGSMHMLDPTGNKEVKKELDICKDRITANLQRDIEISSASEAELDRFVGPKELTALRAALLETGNPRKLLFEIHKLMGELLAQLEEMLENMGSGDERCIEGGEGVRGSHEDDIALSGVKLYKGETLLELTERWRFIYDRLYDPEKEEFDLSRIPVHDNVRFDTLHNPHLGLTDTLQRLYILAKTMADCVVPQEYGSTLSEKRDLGVKICHGLLEKIMYDLNVARTDNKVDMRYMINMKYEADLPITTMGRRIRTRLYFTSESHLHTVLNVFRFAQCGSRLLSPRGLAIVNATRELCYLTQIVMRVFEDNRRAIDDPRRFRVEILFSPGATATPRHIDEDEREHDLSRYGTEPLQEIGREGLTCAEVEEFFEMAIMAGKTEDDDTVTLSTAPVEIKKKDKKKGKKAKKVDISDVVSTEGAQSLPVSDVASMEANSFRLASLADGASLPDGVNVSPTRTENAAPIPEVVTAGSTDAESAGAIPLAISRDLVDPFPENKDNERKPDPDMDMDKRMAQRKVFWSTVAIASIALGVVCLASALDMAQGRRRRYQTRY